MKYFLRTLVLPLVLAIVIIHSIYRIVLVSVIWIRYGGELVLAGKHLTQTTMKDILDELVKQRTE